MKNISFIINIILFIAVCLLYYFHFSGRKTEETNASANSDSLSAISHPHSLPLTIPSGKDVRIVFLNADTLFVKYEYAKKVKTSGEKRIASYKEIYQDKMQSFQQEYNDYIQKAGAGAYTKEQGIAIEAGLQKKRDEIVTIEQNQDKLMDEIDKDNADVQKKIYDHIERFNKEHGYYCVLAYTRAGGGVLGINDSLDVTYNVIERLNAEYKTKKK
ncbi:MAG: OmpH family outer membrane protein [Bacteroidota bacterium]